MDGEWVKQINEMHMKMLKAQTFTGYIMNTLTPLWHAAVWQLGFLKVRWGTQRLVI